MSITSMMLGAPKAPKFVPPAGTKRQVKLAGMDEEVGSIDSDDNSYTSFVDFLEGRHPTTQENLRRIAWAIRRTGEVSKLEIMHKLGIESSYMSKLERLLVKQKWISLESRRGSRQQKFYIQTELGKQIFAYTGEMDELKAA